MAGLADIDDDTLVIIFATDRPIGATDIGILLRELSSDYNRATGGRLVLWRYETGSSWIYLRDAIAVAGSMAGAFNDMTIAVQHMRTFARLLWENFGGAPDEAEGTSPIQHVAKSATRIAKIAAEHGADAEISYKKNEKTGLETYSVKLNNQQARRILSRANETKKTGRAPKANLVTRNDRFDVTRMAQQLAVSSGAPDELVDTIVLALKASGGDYLLPSLAIALEGAGRWDLASAVRKHIQGNDPTKLRLTRE